MQGLNSFGNTDFSSMSWFPNMTMPPKFKGSRNLRKYNGRGDPMIHLQMYCRKDGTIEEGISHWKELADTFLAQYGFNSQIELQIGLIRSENGEEEQRNFQGICPKFFVDLIPVGERIEGCLEDKEDSGHDQAPNGISRTGRQESSDKEEGRRCANDREKQRKTKASPPDLSPCNRYNLGLFRRPPTQAPAPVPAPQVPARPMGNQPNDNRWPRKELRQFTPLPMPLTELYPILIEKGLISPVVPRPYNGPQRRGFQPKFNLRFPLWRRLPNITTNPLPNHPEGGVNMVEIEEGNEERIAWRRLFYTLEKKRHITPLDAPPGPSTGDACEYHSGARGHSLECCEEFKKKVTDLMENGLVGREEIPSKGGHQLDDPSDFDWYAEINLDDIVEDEMDLDNLQDEGADWGYFMEDDTDEWRDVDFTKFFQFPCLIVPPGFVTPEFEIFYENGDPEVHLQKYGEKMALHLENELLMISVFPESLEYRFNPHSILEYLGLKKDEEPYIIPDPGVSEVIVEIKEESDMSSLPVLTEGEEEGAAAKSQSTIAANPPPSIITTTTAEEEYAGPMVEGLSIHTITGEEDSTTTPPTRHCQQGEEAKTWTCVPLLQRVSSSNE
uniref:Uncharacterized protein n=1 Tax=Fagus sylvatica TaxID=28930 RepID=A0A2N9F2R3_FAGSY